MGKNKPRPAKGQQPVSSTPSWRTEQQEGVETPVFFWKPNEDWGFMGQWYLEPIIDPTTKQTFNCNEQYMMYHKAMTFNDDTSAQKVLETDSPREQKDLGRKVSGFDEHKWDECKLEIVVTANLMKFSQGTTRKDDSFVYPPNGHVQGQEEISLKELLLSTGDRELVEASARDRVWGIGFSPEKAVHVPRYKWGKNLLGKALMEVRARLIREEEQGLNDG